MTSFRALGRSRPDPLAAEAASADEERRVQIVAEPTRLDLVDAWMTVMRERECVDAIGQLIDLQRTSPDPLPAVLVRALGSADGKRARRKLKSAVAAFLASPEAAVCRRVWDDYAALRPLDKADAWTVRRMPIAVVQLVFLARPPRIVALDKAAKAGLGVSAGAMRWYRTEFMRPDGPFDRPEPEFVSDYARARFEHEEPLLGYQTRIVRDRRLELRDPFTGTAQAPFDSVSLFGRTVYSFGADRLSLMVAGGLGSRAQFISLANANVLIDLGADDWQHMTPSRVANLHAQLLRRVVKNRDLFARACAERPRPDAERQVVVLSMMVENFAHHLWNSYPGVERIVDCGLASHVDELRVGGSEFFGSFEGVFPEFAGARIVEEPGRGVRDPYPFSPEHVLVSPGGYFIRRSVVDRVVSRMSELPETPGTIQPPLADERPFPVVWFGLRTGSRAWVDQERDVPRIIDTIHRSYPEAVVVLDGFSRPVGRDVASARWKESIAHLNDIAEGIRSAVEHPDQVLNLVGNTMRESVLWAAVTDVYIAPNGTTQHKVGWLSHALGLVYSSPSLLNMSPESRPGAYESEGRPIPTTLAGTPVGLGELRSAIDIRPHLDNIRLDADEVTRLLLDLIARRLSARTADA